MRLKIRCDGESEKFCKTFWELNKALIGTKIYHAKDTTSHDFGTPGTHEFHKNVVTPRESVHLHKKNAGYRGKKSFIPKMA
jgi:hypothetical protein